MADRRRARVRCLRKGDERERGILGGDKGEREEARRAGGGLLIPPDSAVRSWSRGSSAPRLGRYSDGEEDDREHFAQSPLALLSLFLAGAFPF